MSWPKNTYPSSTRYAIIEAFRKIKFRYVALILIFGYLLLNFLFSIIYSLSFPDTSFFDSLYFSFITSSTIGYGDIIPKTEWLKFVVIVQGVSSTFYFALMVSFLGIKMMYPKNTLHFSDKILFDEKHFVFRIINSHRALLVNPEIRVVVVEHAVGNTIARNCTALEDKQLHWFDNHDFSVVFMDDINDLIISEEWKKAISNKDGNSRFKIRVSVSGSYGMQQYVQVTSYDHNDIVEAKGFVPIKYNDEDKKVWRNINFKKFKDFWETFNSYN